ncbi:hypothetical protein CHS0354_003791 [Potamilus streckersoni]|uniref:Uncharacterized protein n=1 Tax=Potamilus streckersoni TaxID=2493646 RepID=A0AAE0T380_9BIVA|nr:hypothetical protein CHS0354_003791 [Potamilus streckersoni]
MVDGRHGQAGTIASVAVAITVDMVYKIGREHVQILDPLMVEYIAMEMLYNTENVRQLPTAEYAVRIFLF